jgi:hypothetical protein
MGASLEAEFDLVVGGAGLGLFYLVPSTGDQFFAVFGDGSFQKLKQLHIVY